MARTHPSRSNIDLDWRLRRHVVPPKITLTEPMELFLELLQSLFSWPKQMTRQEGTTTASLQAGPSDDRYQFDCSLGVATNKLATGKSSRPRIFSCTSLSMLDLASIEDFEVASGQLALSPLRWDDSEIRTVSIALETRILTDWALPSSVMDEEGPGAHSDNGTAHDMADNKMFLAWLRSARGALGR
ncbi:hypothetical protein EJ03DRAFT_3282 [Teratosphaeria nubilosa]|uniref:Uncharacterized protein n=1 Tax=Teratosphaeria nubilosa TaxID=161662 RepID=A0A6G1LMZ8_9PEZI|nr:hypothetical protein EJ03DRAFT_3282 [Teratosphaeria nubilosa]